MTSVIIAEIMSHSIKVAIVGAGLLGTRHARVFSEQPNAGLVAVVDVDPQRANALASRHGARAFATLAQALEEIKIDAVAVATPDHLHFEPVMAALAAGRHVFLEKPIETSLDKARSMAAAAERALAARVIVAVNYSQRWLADYAWIKHAIDAGDIGEPRMVTSIKWDALHVPTGMLSWAARSSPFYFMSSHDIDLACWYLGRRPTQLVAHETRGVLDALGVSVHDGVNALIQFEGGISASFHSSWLHPNTYPVVADGSLQIIGSLGAIFYNNRHRRVEFYNHKGGQEIQFTGPATATEQQGRLEGAFTESVREFLRCLAAGEEPTTSPRRVLVTSEIQDAAMRSIALKAPVIV